MAMTPEQIDELARLRASITEIETRVQDTLSAAYRIHEGIRDAKIALTLILNSHGETPRAEQHSMIVTHGPVS